MKFKSVNVKKWCKRIAALWLIWYLFSQLIWISSSVRGLPSKAERLLGVSRIWKESADFYALWDQTEEEPGWDEAYRTACRDAADAKSARGYYLALRKFLANLHDGHADGGVIAGTRVANAKLPFFMEWMDGGFVITKTSDKRRFPLGARVNTVAGMETGKYLEEHWGQYVGLLTPEARENSMAQVFFTCGKRGSSVKVNMTLSGGEERTETAKWTAGKKVYRGKEPEPVGEELYTSDVFDVYSLENHLYYVGFKTQNSVSYLDEYFDKVVPLIGDGDGVILDVRKNGGGNSMVGRVILESFLGRVPLRTTSAPDTVKVSSLVNLYRQTENWSGEWNKDGGGKSLGANEEIFDFAKQLYGDGYARQLEIGKKMYEGRFTLTRENLDALTTAAEIPWAYAEKRRAGSENYEEGFHLYRDRILRSPLAGTALVVLAGPYSGSATDDFAAVAKAAGVPIVGTRTRGATGSVIRIDAGGGWSVGISTNHTLTPEGEEINNRGIEATIRVEQTAEDYVNGIDRQLLRAVEELERRKAEKK